ncbi:hypothetical protein VE00_06469 [Pseudogymnoascus sp. WSF 3629]|nr:hypothetical protein VE00_06469 [Pseudogymnoascus sp. WSF 3629]
MSYSEQQGGPYPPPRDPRDLGESQYPPPPGEYPPPPGEEDDRSRAYHQRGPMPTNVTLPSISPYDPQYAATNGYPQDPRYRQDPYHQGPPQGAYDQRAYQGEYNRGGPPHMAFSQTAPRQRTAIACRYCRRRKIRCSGFEDNPTGKCQNCQRFQQECIFTPVSSQAQAFVPAHAAYPHMRNVMGPDGRPRHMYQNQQLYGAHGQPLGPIPQQGAQGGPQYGEYAVPSPTGSYNSFTEDRGADTGRKRPHGEPQTSILPPPNPGQPPYPRQEPGRRPPVDDDLRLAPVTPVVGQANSNYSPGSSTSSTSGRRPGNEGLPSMSRTPPLRSSPGDRSDPMALGNIMERRPETEIDRNMLGRLGRK